MKNKVSGKLKRFVSYMLVLLMFFFNFAFFLTVKAVGTPTLTIGSQSASNGDSISVPLTANDFIDVGSMTFKVNYDNSHLTYTGYTLVSIDSEDTTVNNPGSKVSVVWEDLNNPLNLEEAVIMTINFNVISEESIESNVTFSNTEIGDNTGEELPSIFTPGVITLNPNETEPEIDSYTLQVSGEEATEANNVIFSPNDDGIKDTVTIDLAFSEEVDYEINIKSGENAVKSWSGQATNPNAKIWNGEGSVGDGIYTIEVIIIDEAENSVTDTSKTITLDTTAPVITLNGINPVTIEVGVAYNDAGASAIDNIDGEISGSINKGGNAVNKDILGTYVITYNITDRAGNSATEITRTVNVVDTTAPIITLIGNNPANVEVGYEYNDAGATASDNYDGNITNNIIIVNNVDYHTVGTYIVTYNVSDSSGNPAIEVNRTVNITQDATVPVITLLGTNPVNLYVGDTYADVGATAADNIDGNITANIITAGLPINTAIPGAYVITYNVSDAAGNPAIQITRTVNVVDVTTPIITLLGENPITIELGAVYTDAGATALDNVDGDITANIITVNPVNSNIVGVYVITYNAADLSGNPAPEVTRTVNVVDTTAPIITLLGNNPANTEVGYEYSDAGATASDNYNGNITGNIIIVSNVDYHTVGTYAVTYNVSDLSGNPAAEVVRTVNITPDATVPVITLNSGNKSIYQGTIYTDLGAAALDNIDGNITANIIVTGLPLDTTLSGVYTIAYNVLDAAGNKAVEITRTVNVLQVAESQALIQEEMILDAKAPEIMIGDNAPLVANINVSSTIANAQLNFSALLSGDAVKSAIIPSNLTINSDTSAGKVSVQIPQGAQVSGASSWTGKINLPQAQENSSVNVIPNFGYAAQVSAVIEIGFGDILLNFDKAARIKIDNQAGKYIGYSRSGVFTPITNVCSADSQTAGNALPTAGDCKIDVGSDLIVWTKHFTKFAVYTQTAIPSPISSGGGSVFVAPAFTAPVEGLSIAINNGAKITNSENVVLTLNGGSQAEKMAIANTADFAGASQETYVTAKKWTLLKSEGVKTVYVKFYNSYGSPSAIVSASIQLSAQLAPTAPADVIDKTPAPIQAILGIKTYNDGALLRGSDKRIYLVNNGQLQYIANLKELAKYIRKEILNVKDDVIAFYGPAVLGAKEYADNSLIRGSDQKIYVIINRKKKLIANFDDLRKNYFNRVINNVSDSVVNQY